MPALLTRMSRPPRRSRRLADHAHDVVLGGDVALDEDVADAVLPHLPQAGVHLLLGPGRLVGRGQVVDGDVGAVLGEPHGGRLPDPGGAAGHQHVLALQAGHPPRGAAAVNGGRVVRASAPLATVLGDLLIAALPARTVRPRARRRTRGATSTPTRPRPAPAATGALDAERGEDGAVGARIDREPGERAPAAARRRPAARGGEVRDPEPRAHAVVDHVLRASRCGSRQAGRPSARPRGRRGPREACSRAGRSGRRPPPASRLGEGGRIRSAADCSARLGERLDPRRDQTDDYARCSCHRLPYALTRTAPAWSGQPPSLDRRTASRCRSRFDR